MTKFPLVQTIYRHMMKENPKYWCLTKLCRLTFTLFMKTYDTTKLFICLKYMSDNICLEVAVDLRTLVQSFQSNHCISSTLE